ncbi:DnaB-like helicase C-terminal domain-containing protein [Streptomyces sp. NPDC007971]|uniref:DnaB-like helicase C-terminal domain-containing protein n=1 Tax=Streptomyces sp. NPDC007971 TaxID=3364799 RepID=UPI0036EEAC8B
MTAVLSHEHKLLCKVIATGDITTVLNAKIKPRHITNGDIRRVFEDMIAYNAEYGTAPTLDAVRADHPTFEVAQVDEPIDYLIDRIRDRRRTALTERGLNAAVEALVSQGDTDHALDIVRALISKVAEDTPVGNDFNWARTVDDRLATYRSYAEREEGELIGLPTGFPSLDRLTLGLQAGQMVTLTGLEKSNKTTTLLAITRAMHSVGARPLLFSFEMSAMEISERLDAFLAGISQRKLRAGELNELEWKRLEKAMRKLEGMGDYIIAEDPSARMTLDNVQAKIDEYQPDSVIIDGAYFFVDSVSGEQQTPLAMTNISRGIKRMAARNGLPFVVTTQALRSKLGSNGLNSGSMGYTSAFAQDATLALGVEQTDDPMFYKLKVLAGRNVPKDEWFVKLDWESGSLIEQQGDPFGEEANDDVPAYAGW